MFLDLVSKNATIYGNLLDEGFTEEEQSVYEKLLPSEPQKLVREEEEQHMNMYDIANISTNSGSFSQCDDERSISSSGETSSYILRQNKLHCYDNASTTSSG